MNKIITCTLFAALLLLSSFGAPVFAKHPGAHPDAQTEPSDSNRSKQATPALTTTQKQELAAIYKELYGKKEQLVGKYLEYGIITEEKAKHWTNRIREQHAKLEKSGFLPSWKNCDKKDKDD